MTCIQQGGPDQQKNVCDTFLMCWQVSFFYLGNTVVALSALSAAAACKMVGAASREHRIRMGVGEEDIGIVQRGHNMSMVQ